MHERGVILPEVNRFGQLHGFGASTGTVCIWCNIFSGRVLTRFRHSLLMYIAPGLSVLVSHVQHFLQQLLTAAACFNMTRACVMVLFIGIKFLFHSLELHLHVFCHLVDGFQLK